MDRITHNVVQGSDEWVLLRCKYYGASEAAAMLGISKKTTRTELLNARAGYSEKQFSDFVQRMVLDKGHEVEAPAMELAEQVIGEGLYPVTMSLGWLSASCDGLTLDGTIAWENKNYNELYFDLVKSCELPEEHRPQCQQVLLVTGAKKLYFTISDGTPEKTAGMWIYPDQFYFDRIQEGWAQFKRDLDSHQYVEYIEAVAEPLMQLPSLSVQIRGEITSSNLPDFSDKAERFLAAINVDLKTDEDFAGAKASAKLCRETAKKLVAQKELILAQVAEIDLLSKTIDHLEKRFNAKGLMLEKLVISKESEVKAAAINAGKDLWIEHIKGLSEELTPISMNISPPDFATAIKNKRTLVSMHNAINTELANCKIKADSLAKELRSKLAWYKAHASDFSFLFADLQTLIYKQEDDFKLAVEARIDRRKKEAQEEIAAKIQAEKDRMQRKLEADAVAALAQELPQQANISQSDVASKVESLIRQPITITGEAGVVAQDIPLNLIPSAEDVIRLVADKFFSSNFDRARKFLCNTNFSLT